MRPIDADAASARVLAAMEKARSNAGKQILEQLIDFLDARPTVAAGPAQHGRWEKGGYACGETEWKCSVCGETEWRTACSRMKFCMFCGAKMDAGGNKA